MALASDRLTMNRNALAALAAALGPLFSGETAYAADPVAQPVDISANVIESIRPGSTVFHDSKPLFDTAFDPKQSSELLHLSDTGVNASGRSTNISSAFASSLAESNGNGGVGVSQLIFGSPGGPGQDVVRQLAAQSLWTNTFLYTGTPTVDVTLHLHIPTLQVGLLGVPPRRSGPSAAETAEARAEVDAVVMHPDGSGEKFTFEAGLRESEKQIPSGKDLLNLGVVDVIDTVGDLITSVKFNGDDFNPSYTVDPLLVDVVIGPVKTGDIMSYVYTLTAEGTTHGFERGYDAFIGDPFGVDVITDNLAITFVPSVPETSTSSLLLLGIAGLVAWRQRRNGFFGREFFVSREGDQALAPA